MGGQSRDGQHEMARQVAQAIDSGDHLLVQAGTGTGKSLAYLIPLIAHSLVSDKPTLVSTATLALQTQIVGRDLPRLLKTITPALERPVKVALVKGRSNYVCRHKLEGGFPSEEPSEGQLFSLGEDTSVPHFAAAMGGPSSQLGKEVVRLREWAEDTVTGDRDELLPGVTDRAWRQVSVTSMECLGAQKCPLAAECFSELARQNAADADVVVTNHAMLAVSAFEGLAVLPEYDVVVVDEAHELQDRVTGAVSGQLSVAMVHVAASGARKHTGITVDALNNAASNLELAIEGVPSGLMPNGLNSEQLDCVDQLRDACRAALSDSKGDSANTADGGRQLARSRLMVILELCERLLAARENREVVWFSRNSTFDPQQGYSQPDESAAGAGQHRPAQRRRTAARGPVRGPHRHPDLGHPGDRVRFRTGRRRPRPGRDPAPPAGPASTSARPSNTPSRASSTLPSTCPSPAAARPRKRSTSSRS